MTTNSPKIQRAIISVSDKTGLAEFAEALTSMGIELFSTGGTRRHLEEHGMSVVDVSSYTGFPEMMDGRLKTLHPKVFGGILCRRDLDSDMQSISDHEIMPFELVVVNLYPFQATITRPDVTDQLAIENIDIGGPSLVRAAAKNSAFVTIATSPDQYSEILNEIQPDGKTSLGLRRKLMVQAFRHTAEYDRVISEYFGLTEEAESFPCSMDVSLTRQSELRYGENSHQPAALYSCSEADPTNLVNAVQRNGKELSYNNYLDMDAALSMVRGLGEPTCVVIKHNNPCGGASASDQATACQLAFEGDPTSAFGSVVGFNGPVTAATADYMADGELFVEAIVAPSFEQEAFDILTTRPKWKKNVRLVECPMTTPSGNRIAMRQIHGGMLVQKADQLPDDPATWNRVVEHADADQLDRELEFAWHMVRFVKSNAIALCKDRSLVGVGAGQMSRVDSVKIAIEKAGDRAAGSVLSSDAFFPFPDSIEIAAKAGIVGVIQPGGSVKDDEVIAACKENGIYLVLTGRRHFLH